MFSMLSSICVVKCRQCCHVASSVKHGTNFVYNRKVPIPIRIAQWLSIENVSQNCAHRPRFVVLCCWYTKIGLTISFGIISLVLEQLPHIVLTKIVLHGIWVIILHHLVWKAHRRIEGAIRIYFVCITPSILPWHGTLARYVKLRVAHAPEMPGTVSFPLWVRNPDMHHGTCMTRVPWCMPGSLTSGFLWSRWRGKHSRHSPQFYVSGKRPLETLSALLTNVWENPKSSFQLWWVLTLSLLLVLCNSSAQGYLRRIGTHVMPLWCNIA